MIHFRKVDVVPRSESSIHFRMINKLILTMHVIWLDHSGAVHWSSQMTIVSCPYLFQPINKILGNLDAECWSQQVCHDNTKLPTSSLGKLPIKIRLASCQSWQTANNTLLITHRKPKQYVWIRISNSSMLCSWQYSHMSTVDTSCLPDPNPLQWWEMAETVNCRNWHLANHIGTQPTFGNHPIRHPMLFYGFWHHAQKSLGPQSIFFCQKKWTMHSSGVLKDPRNAF